jgi:hypothetical protein
MKVGDEVKVKSKPEYGVGKVVKFHAKHGTILVEFANSKGLTYCNHTSLELNEGR